MKLYYSGQGGNPPYSPKLSQVSPGLCLFGVKLPCLAKQRPAWEGDFQDQRVRGPEIVSEPDVDTISFR